MPIKPSEIAQAKQGTGEGAIPQKVFDVFDALITSSFNPQSRTAVVKQNQLLGRICIVLQVDRNFVFERGWLNVEDVYEEAGWDVEYDKPGYNESYEAFYTFTAKRGAR